MASRALRFPNGQISSSGRAVESPVMGNPSSLWCRGGFLLAGLERDEVGFVVQLKAAD